MRKLRVERNQLNYTGLFISPAFPLWGEGGKILDGLFTAFAPYNLSLSSLRNNTASLDPSDQEISVIITGNGVYRFKFDRIEFSLFDFDEEQLETIPDIITRGENWLREAVTGFGFQRHIYNYATHCKVDQSNSQNILRELSSVNVPEIGESKGNGVILHYQIPDRSWQLQLTIDHSQIVSDGLFIQFIIISTMDKVEHGETLGVGRRLLFRALESINLEFNEG